MFGPEDVTNYIAFQPIPSQTAEVNNTVGDVYDTDNPGEIQDTFTPNPGNAIGFYIQGPVNTYYSISAFNPQDGFDYVAVFEHKTVPGNYLIAFDLPQFDAIPAIPALTYHEIAEISPVPVPASLLLFGSGLIGLISLRRGKRK